MSTKNQDCFLAILKYANRKLKTQELLEYTDQFPDLCAGCKSGNDVILAGMKLLKTGKINREVGSGGYYWFLVENQK